MTSIKKSTWAFNRLSCIGILLSSHLLVGCSSSSIHSSEAPSWVHQTARTVDHGYIVYIGTGEDRASERALFKAEGSVVQDIANECSFAPKGAHLEDRYDQIENVQHRYYVKMSLSFEECEDAKRASDPNEIKKLANAQLTEQLKRYQDLFETSQNNEEKFAENEEKNANLSSPSQTPSQPIQNNSDFFIARQQIVYIKQVAIFAPANAYPPQAPQTTQFVQQITPNIQNVQTYEKQNPEIRTSSKTWSQVRERTSPRRSTAFKGASQPTPAFQKFRNRNTSLQQRQHMGGRSFRRRRR